MPVHIDSVSLCIPSVILSRFYQQNLGVAAHLKNAHCDETSILLYLLNEASIYPDTTGTIKELAAFWYNFTYIEVPPSLQSLIRNEARLHKTSFFLYKLLHIININTCNMFIHIDTYNIYIYICVYIYLNICLFYIYYTLCILLLAYKLIFCGSKPQWWALWIDRWIQFKNLQKGRERNFQWNFDVAPSQDASGKWRFSSGFPIENVIILGGTATGRGPQPNHIIFVNKKNTTGFTTNWYCWLLKPQYF